LPGAKPAFSDSEVMTLSLAQRRWRPEEAAQRLEPIYLRAPDTTLPKGAAPT